MAQIKLRRDSAANWISTNPVLALGEPGYDTTSNKIKIGNGTSTWLQLSFLTDATGPLLPANSVGFLSNDGAGNLSWSAAGSGSGTTDRLTNGSAEFILNVGGANNPFVAFPLYNGGQLQTQGGELGTTVGDLALTSQNTVAIAANTAHSPLVWGFDTAGTLTTPSSILPRTFTATCDSLHLSGPGKVITSGEEWHFDVTFNVTNAGDVETLVSNTTPWATNPGYVDGDVFEFTESDHGIPGYSFLFTILGIQNPGLNMWTTNPAVNQPPALPSAVVVPDVAKFEANKRFIINTTDFETGGLQVNTARGRLNIGTNMEVPGAPTHFHIAFDGSNTVVPTSELILGDDFNYVRVNSYATGVTIGTDNRNGGGAIDWQFSSTGIFQMPQDGVVSQNNSYTRITNSYVNKAIPTVVWTSYSQWSSSVKLTIMVEGSITGDNTGLHTQSCEAIIAARGSNGAGEPAMSVYGVIHTGVDDLMTFIVQRNPTTNLIEIVGTTTAAVSNQANLRIHSVEIGTTD